MGGKKLLKNAIDRSFKKERDEVLLETCAAAAATSTDRFISINLGFFFL